MAKKKQNKYQNQQQHKGKANSKRADHEKLNCDSDCKENSGQQKSNGKMQTTGEATTARSATAAMKTTGFPKGLANLGNTCFYNSTMQCLLNTAPLDIYFDGVVQHRAVNIPANYRAKMGERCVEAVEAEIQFEQTNDQMAMFWALKKFHEDYKSPGSRSANPSPLFQQICKKVPRFRGFHQQDAHELLRYLLDNVRQDEISRFQRAFSEHFQVDFACKDPEKKAEVAERKLLFRALLEGPARPKLDAVFGGQLQQTIHCTHCKHTSVCIEPFFDLSLPLHYQSDQPDGKPVNQKEGSSRKSHQKAGPAPGENGQAGRKEDRKEAPKNSTSTAQAQSNGKLAAEQSFSGDLHKQRRKEREERKRQNKARKAEAKKNKQQQQKRQKSASLGPVSANGEEEHKSAAGHEEEEDGNQEEKALAEAEATSVPTLNIAPILDETEENGLENMEETQPESDPQNGHEQKEEEAVEKREEEPLVNGGTREEEPNWEQEEARSGVHALASGSRVDCEKTVVGALAAFTGGEVLRPGPNGYSCGKCADEAKKRGEKQPPAQALAIKRYLILTPPLILTLHLKRFEQTARSMKKSNVFVGFDPLLDLGPFSSDKCKRIQDGQQNLLYSLYGVVAHHGDLKGGHYIAYVRCRPKMNPKRLEELFQQANAHGGNQTPTEQAELLEQKLRELRLTNGLDTEESGTKNTDAELEALRQQHADNWDQSEWYYCSDHSVSRVDEKVAMKAQIMLQRWRHLSSSCCPSTTASRTCIFCCCFSTTTTANTSTGEAAPKTYYELLGIVPNASLEQIKSAYFGKCKQFHPDAGGQSVDFKQDFERVKEAYEVLKSEENRQRYDAFLGHKQAGNIAQSTTFRDYQNYSNGKMGSRVNDPDFHYRTFFHGNWSRPTETPEYRAFQRRLNYYIAFGFGLIFFYYFSLWLVRLRQNWRISKMDPTQEVVNSFLRQPDIYRQDDIHQRELLTRLLGENLAEEERRRNEDPEFRRRRQQRQAEAEKQIFKQLKVEAENRARRGRE